MKYKLIYSAIIAAIFIAAMIIYKDEMSLVEIVLAFASMASTIVAVYKWISTNEERSKKEDAELKVKTLERGL